MVGGSQHQAILIIEGQKRSNDIKLNRNGTTSQESCVKKKITPPKKWKVAKGRGGKGLSNSRLGRPTGTTINEGPFKPTKVGSIEKASV